MPDTGKEKRIALLTDKFSEVLEILGLNVSNENIKDTPKRISKMFVNEMFSSLYDDPPRVTSFPNDGQYDQMLVERDINFNSCCEHHFVSFSGKCHIAYMPGKRVIGLSKFSRIVNYCARQPQLQERLTKDIAEFLKKVLETEDIAVVVQAKHFCCSHRGVRDPDMDTITSYVGGMFRNKPEVKSEFLYFLNLHGKLK